MADANQMVCDGFDPGELFRRQESIIETYGYSVIMTWTEDGTPFCYTVGRAQHDLPELLLFGMQEMGKAILNDIATLIREETTDGFYQKPDWLMPLYAGEASDVGDFARFAFGRQAMIDPANPVRVMQVVTPDANGRMPWDADCDPLYIKLQPLHIRKPKGSLQ